MKIYLASLLIACFQVMLVLVLILLLQQTIYKDSQIAQF